MKQGTDTKEVSDAALRQGLRKEQWEQAEEYNNDGDSSEEDGESGDLIHFPHREGRTTHSEVVSPSAGDKVGSRLGLSTTLGTPNFPGVKVPTAALVCVSGDKSSCANTSGRTEKLGSRLPLFGVAVLIAKNRRSSLLRFTHEFRTPHTRGIDDGTCWFAAGVIPGVFNI